MLKYVTLLAFCLAFAIPSATRAASAASYNLTGTWTSSDGGTALALTQSGHTLTWVGGPHSRAWIQHFQGTLSGTHFSGVFQQDAPNVSPPRYHGTMMATIEDSCHFVFTSIEQTGQPTLSGIGFVKSPCLVTTKPLLQLGLYLYKKRFQAEDRDRASCPSVFECVVANGALVTICNHDDFNHRPFILARDNQAGGAYGKIVLHPHQCFKKRLINKTSAAIQVKIYDELHSQERFVVTVVPT